MMSTGRVSYTLVKLRRAWDSETEFQGKRIALTGPGLPEDYQAIWFRLCNCASWGFRASARLLSGREAIYAFPRLYERPSASANHAFGIPRASIGRSAGLPHGPRDVVFDILLAAGWSGSLVCRKASRDLNGHGGRDLLAPGRTVMVSALFPLSYTLLECAYTAGILPRRCVPAVGTEALE